MAHTSGVLASPPSTTLARKDVGRNPHFSWRPELPSARVPRGTGERITHVTSVESASRHLQPTTRPGVAKVRRLGWAARGSFFADAEYAVIHVGKASAYKNRLGAMRAFALLRRRLPTARMFLVHGPASPEERDFVAESGCGSAFLHQPIVSATSQRVRSTLFGWTRSTPRPAFSSSLRDC